MFPVTYFPDGYWPASFFPHLGGEGGEEPEGDERMPQTFRGVITTSILGQYAQAGDLATAELPLALNWPKSYTSGTGSNQADRVFGPDTRTLGPSATEDFDLAGSNLDAFGNALTLVEITEILIRAHEANTNNVVVGGASGSPWVGPFGAGTHTIAIPPGGQIRLSAPAAGWTVTASTADLLKFANSAGTTPVSFDVILIGRSA